MSNISHYVMKELRYTLSMSLASVQNANEIKQSLTAPRWCLGRALSRYKPSTNRGLELPPFRGQVEILFVKMTDTCPGHPGSIFESLLCVLGWRYEEKTLHLCPARQELITLSTSVSEDHSRHLAQTHLIPGPYCCLHV